MLTASVICLLVGAFLLYFVSINFDKIPWGRTWHILLPISLVLLLCGASMLPWGIAFLIVR